MMCDGVNEPGKYDTYRCVTSIICNGCLIEDVELNTFRTPQRGARTARRVHRVKVEEPIELFLM